MTWWSEYVQGQGGHTKENFEAALDNWEKMGSNRRNTMSMLGVPEGVQNYILSRPPNVTVGQALEYGMRTDRTLWLKEIKDDQEARKTDPRS